MTNTRTTSTPARLGAIAAGIALLASACGSDTTTNSNPAESDDLEVTPVLLEETEDDAAEPGDTPDAPADEPEQPAEPAPGDDDPTPTPPPPPGPSDEATPIPASCGDFGPMLEHELMPTLLFDTDGDGEADDEATAYFDDGSWHLRIVENGVISEQSIPEITGYAHLNGSTPTESGDQVHVLDADLGTDYTFATVDGCVELVVKWFDRLKARDPDKAERIRKRAAGVSNALNRGLERLPENWTRGLYLPDFETDGYVPEKLKVDPFEDLAAKVHSAKRSGEGA